MLGSDYLVINEGAVPAPTSFSYTLNPVENVQVSESGHDFVQVIRLDKHIFSATWEGVDGDTLDELETLPLTGSVTLSYRGDNYVCRARDFSAVMAFKSYLYAHSDGIWNVSLTFTQV